jgi:hypothetical protein
MPTFAGLRNGLTDIRLGYARSRLTDQLFVDSTLSKAVMPLAREPHTARNAGAM